MKNTFEMQGDIVKPESVLDLNLEEVFEGDDKYNEAEIIFANEKRSKTEVEDNLRVRLAADHWWLQDYWHNKNIKEQVIINLGDIEFSIYNFGEQLSSEQIEQIKSIFLLFSSFKNSKMFEKVKAVLIDDVQLINQNTGEAANGYGAGDKAIKLYPNAFKLIEHRVSGVSNLEGTVIHELSHSIGSEFEKEWSERFGWKQRKNAEKLPNGLYSTEYNNDLDKCVTEYAKINSKEDICESMVAALKIQMY